jgi:hypothetical protein
MTPEQRTIVREMQEADKQSFEEWEKKVKEAAEPNNMFASERKGKLFETVEDNAPDARGAYPDEDEKDKGP